MTARRLHCALESLASVATTASVVLAPGAPLLRKASASAENLCGQPRAAEFLVLLERRRPEMRAVADGHAAGGIDGDQRADGEPVARLRRGRADAALEVDRGGAEAGADAAEREIRAGGFRRGVAELAIGRVAAPVLVAAGEQVEQDGARHDRHARLAHRKPRPCSRSQACTPEAASSPKAEPPDSTMASMPSTVCAGSSSAVSRVPGPPPRTSTLAATGGVEHDHGRARAELGVAGMADPQAGNIGDQVAQRHAAPAQVYHGRSHISQTGACRLAIRHSCRGI